MLADETHLNPVRSIGLPTNGVGTKKSQAIGLWSIRMTRRTCDCSPNNDG